MNMKLRRLFTLCLAALLVTGMVFTAAPAAALAAAPSGALSAVAAQAEADVTGTYVSDVYPAASAPGLVMLLSLYPNNNAEMVSFYFSNPPVTERGTWELGDGTVTVTMTENNEGAYDTPGVTTYHVHDGMLMDSAFTFTLLDEVTPEAMEAASADAAASDTGGDAATAAAAAASDAATDTAEASSDAGTDVAASEEVTATADMAATDAMTGTDATGDAAYEVFVTDVYPAADASGMVTIMALYPNMNMEQLTVYLGKDAIHEVGTWSDATEGFVNVTITGSFDEEYTTPVETEYAREGDLLSDGVFTFHQLTIITPADMEAMANPSGTYVSHLYPAADASGMLVVLSLFDNNNAEQVSIYVAKDVISEQGAWTQNDDGTITVSITGTADETYAAPSDTTYTRYGDLLSDGTFELVRAQEVTPEDMDAATGDAAGDAATSDGAADEAAGEDAGEASAPMAVYKSDTLRAADSPGREITLNLYEDGNAEMVTDFLNGTVIVENGAWEQPANGQLSVTLTSSVDQGEYATPIVIDFDDADGMLTAVDPDQSLFGTEGLMLHQQASE